ncbi:hypothetical protein NDU88_004082 [Pleurodeles waltl]|uniref:Uncharacterized protein n=1 Tax=Pleurodeles waltl TaxID=8319 RepID=A0AAV7WUT7_PLEWA|nr:hypothetical protein NDU88_004082 [Pleurodeles waltl]
MAQPRTPAGTEAPVPHRRILLRHAGVQCYWAAALSGKSCSPRLFLIAAPSSFLVGSQLGHPARRALCNRALFSACRSCGPPSGWAPPARASARDGPPGGAPAALRHHRPPWGVPPYLHAGIGSPDRRSARLRAGSMSLSLTGPRTSHGVGRV